MRISSLGTLRSVVVSRLTHGVLIGLAGIAGMTGCSAGSPGEQARWVRSAGEISSCPTALARLESACGPLIASAGVPVKLHVIHSPCLGAWSWPGGNVYVAAPLLPLLTDDELAAVVGHEIGHLVRESPLHTQAALASGASHGDVESACDAIARTLLLHIGSDPSAMRSALLKLAHHPATPAATRTSLHRRAARLN